MQNTPHLTNHIDHVGSDGVLVVCSILCSQDGGSVLQRLMPTVQMIKANDDPDCGEYEAYSFCAVMMVLEDVVVCMVV